jgi:NADPH-dependent 2,4-dienoyl-CoA reductase/sulfur reductase-like enzyme
MLLDESPDIGGQIWRHSDRSALPADARRWVARLERSGATIVTGASVVSVALESGFVITAERNGAPYLVHAAKLILATGARERFLPFPGWTLPGVIGIGGAQALLKAGASFAAKRVVIAGSGPLLLPVAAALTAAGAKVLLVAEQASRAAVTRFALGLWRQPATLVQAARYRAGFLKVSYTTGRWVSAARGHDQLEEIIVTDDHGSRTIACDLLCTGFGLVPNTELARLVGCDTTSEGVAVDAWQRTTVGGVYCVGESTGIGGVDLALVEGEIAGLAASGGEHVVVNQRKPRDLQRRRTALRAVAARMEQAFAPRDELRGLVTPETIVCRCEDVSAAALAPHRTARQAKLYSRAGMGPCQGRICGAALEFLYGWPPDVVRLPTQPILLSTLLADAAPGAGAPPHHGA